MKNETRFRMVEAIDPVRFRAFAAAAQRAAVRRMAIYEHLANLRVSGDGRQPVAAPAASAPGTPEAAKEAAR